MTDKKPSADQEPEKVQTEDGYTFHRQEDGSYTDGDMTFDSYKELKEALEW